MNNKDYGEILCTAINEIVSSRLGELQYDITKMCNVIDDSQSRQGKYIVSDGSARFEAYSSDINYRKGNSVLVLIPNGDYSSKKIIQGRISATDTTPFNYVPPMNTMVKITNNIFANGSEISLLANENNSYTQTDEPIYTSTNPNGYSGYTRFGITADFKTLLDSTDVVEGQYGILLRLTANGITTPGAEPEDAVYEMTFNSSDMIGNLYKFESYFSQEKVFDISFIKNKIKKVEAYLYQNGAFIDGNGDSIEWQTTFGELENQKLPNNIFVKNVKMYFGYEIDRFKDETLIIKCENDKLDYQYKNDNVEKQVSLTWVHKLSDNEFELKDGQNLESNFDVKWFRYNAGYDIIDKYAGNNWEEIYPDVNDKFSLRFIPDIKRQQEQIKAIGIITDDNGDKIYVSNLLVFTNEEQVPDNLTIDAVNALSIVCLDGTEGNYFIYDQNGNIIKEALGNGYKRALEARYNGAKITDTIGEIDAFEWWIPYDKLNKQSMIYIDDSQVVKNKVITLNGIDYYCIGEGVLSETGELDTKVYYSIKNFYSQSYSINTVVCRLQVNGNEFWASKEFQFGKAGTNGTNLTFVLDIMDNKDAVIINGGKITIEPHLYDANGERIDFTKEEIKKVRYKSNRIDSRQLAIDTNKNLGYCTLTCNCTSVPRDNYNIIEAIYTPTSGYELTTYLPIAIKDSETTGMFEGTKQVIYDMYGNPHYYEHSYILHEYIDGEYVECGKNDNVKHWTLSVASNDEMLNGYNPKLVDTDKLYNNSYRPILKPSKFYVKDYNDRICVSYVGKWSQPILILQSQYDMSMLNSWDGSLTINETDGTIMATMFGAGRKNSNNTFSGVLIGDVKAGTDNDNAEKMTGVYGIDNGVVSYQLREDGTAIFGANGRGQIQINGASGTIQNGGYPEGTGMQIDLNSGSYKVKYNNQDRIIIDPGFGSGKENKPFEFKVLDNNESHTPLINIKTLYDDKNNQTTNEYYFQSSGFENQNGAKMNLASGELDIKSKIGQFYASGGGGKEESTFLRISLPIDENESIKTYGNSILNIGYKDDSHTAMSNYLQSKNYNTVSFIIEEIAGKRYKKFKTTNDTKLSFQALFNSKSQKFNSEDSDTIIQSYVKVNIDDSYNDEKQYYIKGKNYIYSYRKETIIDREDFDLKKNTLYYININTGNYDPVGDDAIYNKNISYYIQIIDEEEKMSIVEILSQEHFEALKSNGNLFYLDNQQIQAYETEIYLPTRYLEYDESLQYYMANADGSYRKIYGQSGNNITAEYFEKNSKVLYYKQVNYLVKDVVIQQSLPYGHTNDQQYKDLYNKLFFEGDSEIYVPENIYTDETEQIVNPFICKSNGENLKLDFKNDVQNWFLYFSSLKAQLNTNEKSTNNSGFHLDFENGRLTGYNVNLELYKQGNDKNQFIKIDSSDPNTPLNISNKFKVQWDGTLICDSIFSPTTDSLGNTIIKINDNFSITSSGASGGSANFGQGNFGGLSLGGSALTKNSVQVVTGLVFS